MAIQNLHTTLVDLARRGEYRNLEDRWLVAMELTAERNNELLETLEVLTKNGKGEMAAALGWSWLTTRKEKADPAEVLELGRELMIRCGDSPEMRQEILGLYREVYADRPELQSLIEASGLNGEKTPRRALRTLEICLNLKEGDYLLSRSEERAAQVVQIDLDGPEYTIRTKRGEDTLDPDSLALQYDAVGPNDFRALSQLHPEKINDLLESDPAALVIGLLHSHRDKMDSDELKHLLSPKYLAPAKWSSWWSKARAAMNRSPNIVLEGRNPVMIVFHHTQQTLEDEIGPQWAEADTPQKRLATVETYLREAKARGSTPAPAMVARMHRDLMARTAAARKGAPTEALLEALVTDRLAQDNLLTPDQQNPVQAILRENNDVPALLKPIEDSRFYLRAIEHLRKLYPEQWADLYLELLPHAPVDGCEEIAAALTEAGHQERLKLVTEQVLSNFGEHLDAVCWLWRGKLGASLLPISARALLIRILEHLGQVSRDDYVGAKVIRDTRTKIRAALSAANYSRFRQVIQEMEAGLASTVRTTIDRLDGLGHTVRINLMRIVTDTHPELTIVRNRQPVDPWQDDTVIYCTQQGFEKRKEEIDYLNRVKIPENARAIGEAASRGDLSENSEYKFALEERDLLQARLMKMQNELGMARTVSPGEVSTDAAGIGTRISLVGGTGERREFTILGPFESDMDQGVYNYRAPLCARLRGLRVGDTVKLELGAGEQEYRIESITNAVAK
jgi:transcription elongation GreA/GreB family factor/transcription elongation factor GreA-like protein